MLFIVFNGEYSRLTHREEDLNPLSSFNAWYLILLMLLFFLTKILLMLLEEEEDEQ